MKKVIILLYCIVAFMHSSFAQDCEQTFYDGYSDSTLWTHVGPTANVIVDAGTCQFNNAWCDHYDKVLRQLPFTLSDNYWKAEFKFAVTATNAAGNGVGAHLLAATAGNLDVWTYDATSGYAFTNQDGISVLLQTVATNDNNIDHWQFIGFSKKGNNTESLSTGINASSSISTYYLRIERFAIDSIRLSVYSDTAYSNHLPGSPVTSAIDPAITGLNYIQHGVVTQGYNSRHLTGIIDSLNICNGGLAGIAGESTIKKTFSLFPNPANDILNISFSGLPDSIGVFNIFGQKMFENLSSTNKSFSVASFPNGIYFVRAKNKDDFISERFIVLH